MNAARMATTLDREAANPRDRGASEGSVRRIIRRFSAQRIPMIALAILTFFVLVALFGPQLAPHNPNAVRLEDGFASPSVHHWLGADQLGRDVFSRLLVSTRISLAAASLAACIACCVGVPLGLLSGYLGGYWDATIMRASDTVMSLPALVLAIAIVGTLGPSLSNAMIAIGVVNIPPFARISRGIAAAVRHETYVEAARTIGCSSARIIRRHVLPNALPPLVVQVSLTMGAAIIAEASLSFLGLGVQPPDASLGLSLKVGFDFLYKSPVLVLAPSVIVVLLVLSCNFVGDGIRDSIGREERRSDGSGA